MGEGGGPGVGIDLGEIAQGATGHADIGQLEAADGLAELEGDGGAFTGGQVTVGGADDQGRGAGVGGQGQAVTATVVAGQVGVEVVGDADARGVAATLGEGGGPGVGIDLGEVAQGATGHADIGQLEAADGLAELEGDGGAFTSGQVAVGGADDQGWYGCIDYKVSCFVRFNSDDFLNPLIIKAQPRRLKTNRRIKPLASFIQQYKTVATASCAAGIASRTWAGCGCFEVCGGVKASSEGLFQVGVWGVFTYVVLLGFRRCLPPAVLPHGDDFAIRQLQSHFAAQACQDLLTLEQALAFKYLALDAVEGNGENLTNKAFNDGDESAHKSGSELGA